MEPLSVAGDGVARGFPAGPRHTVGHGNVRVLGTPGLVRPLDSKSRQREHPIERFKLLADRMLVDLMSGVKTNIVTLVEIDERYAGDCLRFAPPVKTTARSFGIREVSADTAFRATSTMNWRFLLAPPSVDLVEDAVLAVHLGVQERLGDRRLSAERDGVAVDPLAAVRSSRSAMFGRSTLNFGPREMDKPRDEWQNGPDY